MIKTFIILTLQKMKMFNYIYFFIVSIRRFFYRKKKFNFQKNYEIIGKDNYDFFLGYYDINNFSFDEKKILFHQKSKSEKFVFISIYSLLDKKIKNYDVSFAWSWQLGSRLKWISDNEFIFNTIDSEKNLISKSINVKTKKKTIYPFSYFAIDSNSNHAININFKKLEKKRPGYGYSFSQKNINDNENFISIWNIKTKKIKIKFDEKFLNKLLKDKFENFYFNHASWSTNNIDFIIYAIDPNSRRNKLIFFKNFSNPEIINEIDQISHHEWINEKEIFFYGTINKLSGFFKYNLVSNQHKKINFKFSDKDGHPHSSDKNIFIVDTYPNEFQERLLYTFNLKLKKISYLGSAFNNFYLTNEKKCDFHPKISKKNKFVIFDSSHNLKREIVILKHK